MCHLLVQLSSSMPQQTPAVCTCLALGGQDAYVYVSGFKRTQVGSISVIFSHFKSQFILGTKSVFKRQHLQMFGLKLSKYE